MFEQFFEERGLCGAQKIEQIIAEGVSVLLQESCCTVVHNAREVDYPKSLGLTGFGFDVVVIGGVLAMKLIQHALVCPLHDSNNEGSTPYLYHGYVPITHEVRYVIHI